MTEPVDFNGRRALTTDEAAQLLGISSNTLWRCARDGTAPVPHYRFGRALRWPVVPILRLLRIEEPEDDEAPP